MEKSKNYFGEIDNVVLKPYSATYAVMYQEEKKIISALLKRSLISIDHIGSTAIPFIVSKPVIDIGIAIEPFPLSTYHIDLIKQQGYIYWDTNPSLDHSFFFKGLPRTHQLHLYPAGSHELKRKIVFKEFLLRHPDIAKEYEDLKVSLAKKFYYDRERYTEMKTEFVNRVVQLAGMK